VEACGRRGGRRRQRAPSRPAVKADRCRAGSAIHGGRLTREKGRRRGGRATWPSWPAVDFGE
jgi:hypothetical protein